MLLPIIIGGIIGWSGISILNDKSKLKSEIEDYEKKLKILAGIPSLEEYIAFNRKEK